MKKEILSTPAGDIVLIVHGNQLFYCNWDNDDCKKKELEAEKKISGEFATEAKDEEEEILMKRVKEEMNEYFAGMRREFDLPIRLLGTPFQQKVWEGMLNIGYGQVVTYGGLAKAIGHEKGVRCVANACGRNPLAIIVPCHRVVASNGKPGGYTGGLDKKEMLLSLET